MHGPSAIPSGASAVRRRLDHYWKMEAGCALLFPLLSILLFPPQSVEEACALMVSLVACCSLLLLGALYWRAAVKRIDGDSAPISKIVGFAERWQKRLLGLSLAAAAASAALLLTRGVGPAALASIGLSLLACLEYVNYYHVQLQNFDHAPDFRRLVRGRRLRRSHLAADLAALRRGR